MHESTSSKAIGLYVHLPFCRVRCSYCAFAISTDHALEKQYVNALLKELDLRRDRQSAVRSQLESLYFGGGTPSRMLPEHLRRVFISIMSAFELDQECEVTLEANPEDVNQESLSLWKQMGVTRLSIGVQSFHDNELVPLGRVHGSAVARKALDLARQHEFEVNADLILGLPYQTIESFLSSLEIAIAAGVGHLSLYMLDLESGTPLAAQISSGRRTLPEDELTVEMYGKAIGRLSSAGFMQYEISNFARPGRHSRHNLRYWRRQPYMGIGLGAHSFIDGERCANAREMTSYLEALDRNELPVDFRETLTSSDEKHERLFLSLRQTAGLEYSELVNLTGEEGESWVTRGLEEGWLSRREERVAFTAAGFLLSNEYISQLF